MPSWGDLYSCLCRISLSREGKQFISAVPYSCVWQDSYLFKFTSALRSFTLWWSCVMPRSVIFFIVLVGIRLPLLDQFQFHQLVGIGTGIWRLQMFMQPKRKRAKFKGTLLNSVPGAWLLFSWRYGDLKRLFSVTVHHFPMFLVICPPLGKCTSKNLCSPKWHSCTRKYSIFSCKTSSLLLMCLYRHKPQFSRTLKDIPKPC